MAVPTVDVSPFLTAGDEEGRKKVIEMISEACSDYGSFQIINHGVPLHHITQSIELSRTFFSLPDEEKLKHVASGYTGPLIPAGYTMFHGIGIYLMNNPNSSFDYILPENPRDLGNALEKMFESFTKIGELVLVILNECLGLPAGCLEEYGDDRSTDVVAGLSYAPATENDDVGVAEHTDPDCMTLVVQDEVGGLEVKKDGEWVPIVPAQDAIAVNIGDVIKILSNNKFKCATHRVVRYKGKRRTAVAYTYNLGAEKWFEPLPQFTTEIGQKAEYPGFVFKDYQAMKFSSHGKDHH